MSPSPRPLEQIPIQRLQVPAQVKSQSHRRTLQLLLFLRSLGGCIKRWCCLTSVCLSRTSGQSREQKGLGRLLNWHRGSPRHTWLGHRFQGQKVKGRLRFARDLWRFTNVFWLIDWKVKVTGAGAYCGGLPPTACLTSSLTPKADNVLKELILL